MAAPQRPSFAAFAGTWAALGLAPKATNNAESAKEPNQNQNQNWLSRATLKTLRVTLGHDKATPVQASAIPLALVRRRDVVCEAATGSGKTIAFCVPLAEMIARRVRKLSGDQDGSESEDSAPEDPEEGPERTKTRVSGGIPAHEVCAVVLSPVRELAVQTRGVIDAFLGDLNAEMAAEDAGNDSGGAETAEKKHSKRPRRRREVRSMLLVGGSPLAEDVAQFRESGANVLVGTPGRVLAFLEAFDTQGNSGGGSGGGNNKFGASTVPRLRSLEYLVLDEADRLLELGFRRTLDTILARLPKQRRTGLFSATQTKEIDELIRAGLRNPARVNVTVSMGTKQDSSSSSSSAESGNSATPSELTNLYEIVPEREKVSRLVHILEHSRDRKVVVFFLTCACVDYFYRVLSSLPQLKGSRLFSLHGKAPAAKRTQTYRKFVDAPSGALLTTDVASRGLDIPDVDLILQIDAPQDPATFIHRVGRTARIGRKGSALIFLAPHEDNFVEFMQLKRVPLVAAPICVGCGEPHTGSESGPGARDEREIEDGLGSGGDDDDDVTSGEFGKPSSSSHFSSSSSHPVSDATPQIRAQQRRDRAIMDYGVAAYCSFIRGYQSHHCAYIFQLGNLEMGGLAMAFGLLELPKMPELRKKYGSAAQKLEEQRREAALGRRQRRVPHAEQVQDISVPGFEPDPLIKSIESVPYLDKQRERARKKRLAAARKQAQRAQQAKSGKVTAAASMPKQAAKRKEPSKKGKAAKDGDSGDGDSDSDSDDWEEYRREMALEKKLKRRKITQEEYDEQMEG
jgi:ATP-dependent RNA helicase DDX55/SPB4